MDRHISSLPDMVSPCKLAALVGRIEHMTRAFFITLCGAVFLVYARAQTVEEGKRQYLARCVSCHGEDGSGGGHGPNIVDVRRPRATTKEAVRDLIRKGIPGA